MRQHQSLVFVLLELAHQDDLGETPFSFVVKAKKDDDAWEILMPEVGEKTSRYG